MAEFSSSTYIALPVNGTDRKDVIARAKALACERLRCENPTVLEGNFVCIKEPVPKSEKNPKGSPGEYEYRSTWTHTWTEDAVIASTDSTTETITSEDVGNLNDVIGENNE